MTRSVRGRDLGSFVSEVRQKIEREVTFPAGYSIVYGGQFENQERATRRLILVIPLTLAIIFALLYTMFHSVTPCDPDGLIGNRLLRW
jgi:cobalt-zinc-cadmium resistance protein CzcA